MAGSLALRELSDAATTTIALARESDEADIRALLRQSVVPGAVRVAFTREPDYRAGAGLAGAEDHTVVSRRDGALVGLGRASVRTLHRNGQLQRIGYLSELRITAGTTASARMLRDGYALLSEELDRARVDGCFTSITADNARARRVLENGGRFGLPSYRPLARLVTLVAPVQRRSHDDAPSCGAGEREALTAFLQHEARRGQLTLDWDERRWDALARHGVTPTNFCVVKRGARIVAAAAVWDQRPFRQVVIDGYDRALQLGRPLVNVVQRLRGLPPLPAPGNVLPQGALLEACAVETSAWPALWHALQAQAAAMGISWLTLSRDAADPELGTLRPLLRAREYLTTLYEVAWRGRTGWSDGWDARPFRPEVGLL